LISSGEFDLIVEAPEPVPEPSVPEEPTPEPTPDPVIPGEEKLNIGLINKILELIFQWFSKLLGK